jgi:hypothetical protein
VYAVGGAHNDLYWLLLLTAAAVAVGAGRSPVAATGADGKRPGRRTLERESRGSIAAGALVAVACALKLPAVMVAPYLLAGTRRRGAALAGMGLAAALVAAITVIAFGAHPVKMVSDAFDQKPAPFSGPYWLARLLSTSYDDTLRGVCIAAAAVVGLTALAFAWRRRGDPRAWIAGAGWTILAAMLALASFEPWYVLWVLPFAALAGSRALRGAAIVLTLAVVAIHMPLFGYIPAF